MEFGRQAGKSMQWYGWEEHLFFETIQLLGDIHQIGNVKCRSLEGIGISEGGSEAVVQHRGSGLEYGGIKVIAAAALD